MKNSILYFSAKPTADILALFELAEKLDAPNLSRADILERAEHYLIEQHPDLKLAAQKKRSLTYTDTLPMSIKIRINNPTLDSMVNDYIMEEFNITRLKTPFKLRLLLSAYVDYLEGSKPRETEPESLSALRLKAVALALEASEETLTKMIAMMEENV